MTPTQNDKQLVYGEIDDGLVFLSRARAEELVEIRDATGESPTWPAQEMLDLFPAEVIRRYGELRDTLMDGAFPVLHTSSEAELVAELEQLGWTCERDDALVLEASGYE